MTINNLIRKIARHKPEPFLAPIPTTNTTRVLSIQDNFPYWFNVNVDQAGWYNLKPNSVNAIPLSTRHVPHLPVWDKNNYLRQLQNFLVIALYPLNETMWLVTPYNHADASQRGWMNGEPRIMYLVNENLDSYNIINARQLGNILLYDNVNLHHYRALINKDGKHAVEIIERRVKELEETVIKEQKEEKEQNDLNSIKTSLEFMGAQLHSYNTSRNEHTIKWEKDGRLHTTIINENQRVLSAGVCLGNTDNLHSLRSIVSVMEDSFNERGY